MTDTVRLYEVSLRDGLQNEPEVLGVEAKLALLDSLIASGVSDVEVTSFVRPRNIPQLADAAEMVRRLPRASGVRFWALVPNQVGLERAIDAGITHVATFLSASETHNQKNVNRTVAESVAGLRKVIETARSEGLGVRSYISTVFGCPYEGHVDPRRVLDLSRQLLDLGATEISLGDTTGVANPRQVRDVLALLAQGGVPMDCIAAHFHDTMGTALANAYAAFESGVRVFDGSVAGVGGCPYAPGAAGNVGSEDLVHLFHELGVPTGVDLDGLCRAGQLLEDTLGRPLPSRYHRYWQVTGGVERAERGARAVRSA